MYSTCTKRNNPATSVYLVGSSTFLDKESSRVFEEVVENEDLPMDSPEAKNIAPNFKFL